MRPCPEVVWWSGPDSRTCEQSRAGSSAAHLDRHAASSENHSKFEAARVLAPPSYSLHILF
jgi:hypothetical protein